MNRRLTTAAALVLALAALAPTALAGQRPPTPEKARKKIVEYATRLEADPLAKSAKKDREKVLTLVRDAPDLRVDRCHALLGDLLLAKKQEAQLLYVQLEISTAKFIVEHPEAEEDREAALVGGLDGVLATYEAMHRVNPALAIPFVDDLRDRVARDGTEQVVREALADCGQ